MYVTILNILKKYLDKVFLLEIKYLLFLNTFSISFSDFLFSI